MIPVLLDCDPGIDDAVAIALLAAFDQVDLKMITTCAGNVLPEYTYQNARNLISFYGKGEIPVYRGAQKPLYRSLIMAENAHGDSGIGTVTLPESTVPQTEKTALEAVSEYLKSCGEPVTLVATGPLTNVAVLLLAYPELKPKIARIILMGGACYGGNVTPCAEFNVAVDPEAAKLVFESQIPIVMFGLDVTLQAGFLPEDIHQLRTVETKTAQMLSDLISFSGMQSSNAPFLPGNYVEGAHLHDACAVTYLFHPEWFCLTEANVSVETKGEYTSGCTVVDYCHITDRPANAQVAFSINREKFVGFVCEAASRLP